MFLKLNASQKQVKEGRIYFDPPLLLQHPFPLQSHPFLSEAQEVLLREFDHLQVGTPKFKDRFSHSHPQPPTQVSPPCSSGSDFTARNARPPTAPARLLLICLLLH